MRNREDKKSKKGQESTIGKIIYGFLLFMPLIAIGVTCLVNTFNNQAREETEITYKYETNEVSNISDIQYGHIYHVTINSAPSNTSYVDFATAIAIYNLPTYSGSYDVDAESSEISYLRLRYNNNQFLVSSDSYSSVTVGTQWSTISFPFEFDFVARTTLEDYDLTYVETNASEFNIITGTTEKDISNIFYYAVDKVTESPLFSWAENSIIYTTTANTCNALSITTPFIPLLLAYWLIISVIYFLYDIALMLVWIIHRKIHELQESI